MQTDYSDDLLHACTKILRGTHAGQYARIKSFMGDSKVLAEVSGFGEVFITYLGVHSTFLSLMQVWLSAQDMHIVSSSTYMILDN